MSVVKIILIAGWLFWFALYFRLAWNNEHVVRKRALKMFFPILLFIEQSWPLGTEFQRMKLQIGALALTVVTAIEAIANDSLAS